MSSEKFYEQYHPLHAKLPEEERYGKETGFIKIAYQMTSDVLQWSLEDSKIRN